jgi:protein-S-isoprenylcysteine O-methyltransferase Ste14
MKWAWSNVPIPEAHLIGLIAGAGLHAWRPQRLALRARIRRVFGRLLVTFGATLAVWAVQSAGDVNVDEPTSLVQTGPYAWSRNLMYVGWTLIDLGVGLIANTAWIPRLLPVVVLYTDLLVIRREERVLLEQFGDAYRSYRAKVPRYL